MASNAVMPASSRTPISRKKASSPAGAITIRVLDGAPMVRQA